ncbi:Gfo/Idh/MocA family protein [Pseudonocardia sp. TRM90224]|uniref:Gfo/Idh/MocA family protein n=1 Tax=Pseudonocardia sp. TRM90224 TaxID=2812678 RepID=UPI001E4324BE|nr:Gfo/Idh/MocA family oxidoreductase [Pseudonocardia sp. TRM90224]
MSSPLRIGILGAARIAVGALMQAAADTGDRVVAIAARDPQRAAAFAEQHGVERTVATYADLVADPEVDLIYNPLPNGLHGPWNLAAIEAGKDVLSEKPFASNAPEARLVRDAAVAAGVTVVEAFHYVHHPVMRRVLEVVGSGEIGALRSVDATFVVPAPPDADPRWSLPLAGGALMDLGCYSLHANRMLGQFAGGAPSVVSATGQEKQGNPGVDEMIDAQLAFPGGATGRAMCRMGGTDFSAPLLVTGETGAVAAANFVLPHRDDTVKITTAAGTRTENPGTRPSYAFQLEALRAHLRGGQAFPIDLDDAVATAELIDETYLAAGFEPRPTFAG